MQLQIDHIAIAAEDLNSGADWVQSRLGVPMQPGGKHALMGTHNRLLGLGPGIYLEVIAIDPEAPDPGRSRWFGLDRFSGRPRPVTWIASTDDLDAAILAAPGGVGHAVDLERGDLRWRMAIPDTGVLPFDDAFPALIQWQGGAHPSARLDDRGCRLVSLEIAHPDAEHLATRLPMADDRLTFSVGPRALRVVIDTPDGRRLLE